MFLLFSFMPHHKIEFLNHPGSYKPYTFFRYVPPHRLGFLCRFGLKTGIHFAHFGVESGMVFEETTTAYERIYHFNAKCARKKEKCEFEMDLICLRSNLSN